MLENLQTPLVRRQEVPLTEETTDQQSSEHVGVSNALITVVAENPGTVCQMFEQLVDVAEEKLPKALKAQKIRPAGVAIIATKTVRTGKSYPTQPDYLQK